MWLKFDGSESREKGVVGTVEEKRERDSGCECWGCRRRNSLLGNGMKKKMGHFPLDIHSKVTAASGTGALNWGGGGQGGQKRMGPIGQSPDKATAQGLRCRAAARAGNWNQAQ